MTTPTPAGLINTIFIDMGIGPHEAMSMTGDFITRARTAGLTLSTTAVTVQTTENETTTE